MQIKIDIAFKPNEYTDEEQKAIQKRIFDHIPKSDFVVNLNIKFGGVTFVVSQPIIDMDDNIPCKRLIIHQAVSRKDLGRFN